MDKLIMDDDFSDLLYYSEQSLKKIWDNKKDDAVWNKYLSEDELEVKKE